MAILSSRHQITALAVVVIGWAAWISLYQSTDQRVESVPELLARRAAFHRLTGDRLGLLDALDSSTEPSFNNPSAVSTPLDLTSIFLTRSRIISEISGKVSALEASAQCLQTAEGILNFVTQHSRHSFPMFESMELHAPVSFFTTFGSGFCDDAATMMVEIARWFGIPARTIWISKKSGGPVIHVIAELNCKGKWAVYDADNFGIIRGENGSPIDFAELADSAAQSKLKWVREPIIRMDPTYTERYDEFRRHEHGDPWGVLLPGEKRFYLKTPFFITSDGLYPPGGWATRAGVLEQYGEAEGNFVRVVPLATNRDGSTLYVDDYFPIVAAFIRSRGAAQPSGSVTLMGKRGGTQIDLQTLEVFNQAGWIYRDLTPTLNLLETTPSYSLRLSNLESLEAGVELVTVHLYSKLTASADILNKAH